jgi:hypothetical protein
MADNKVIGHYWADPYLQASYLVDDGLLTPVQLAAFRVLVQRGADSYQLSQRTEKGTVIVRMPDSTHRITRDGKLYLTA